MELGFYHPHFCHWESPKYSDHNFKLGVDFSWGHNTIDFSRLLWSDQLDPKYGTKDKFGNLNPTSFAFPNNGRSSWYFNPGFGVSLRSLWNKKSTKAYMTNFGATMYRFIHWRDGEINQSVSVLGLKNSNPYRLSFFAEAEFVPVYFARKYLTFRPMILYQKQGNIDYLESGFRAGYLRNAGIGFITILPRAIK
ncbi:MAG: hypothetical protein IPJ13_01705 [Saprospiraceae bacterium]|nr:hypothetical protein [Saprospiraceae bacterium]